MTLERWEKCENSNVGQVGKRQSGNGKTRGKSERWVVLGFNQGCGTQGESKTSCFCF